jgi:hypothetical protein
MLAERVQPTFRTPVEANVLAVVKQLRIVKRLVSHVTRMHSIVTMIFRVIYVSTTNGSTVGQTRLA